MLCFFNLPNTGNRCLNLGENKPNYMLPVEAGSLLQLVQPQPPASAPSPVLEVSDVAEPPFPAVAEIAPAASTNNTTAESPPAAPNAQAKLLVGVFVAKLAISLPILLLF